MVQEDEIRKNTTFSLLRFDPETYERNVVDELPLVISNNNLSVHRFLLMSSGTMAMLVFQF